MGAYLKFYETHFNGALPQEGLCNCYPNNELLKLFTPSSDEMGSLIDEYGANAF